MWGTRQLADLLRAKNPNIIEFGEQRAFDYIAAQMAAYEAITREMLGFYVEYTTERIQGYGGVDSMVMVKTGEYGRAAPQKVTAGANLGFPLNRSQLSLQWTRDWMEMNTPAELAAQYMAAQQADTVEIQNDIKNALMGSANYSFIDHLTDRYSLPVKRLANADGVTLPIGPNGETFNGATHTHYLAVAALDAASMNAAINTVIEHYKTGVPYVLINSAQETALTALNAANQFIGIQPVQYVQPTNVVVARGNLDTLQIYNRMIGYWGRQAAPVWVKPWVPANYIIVLMTGIARKVLAFRERRGGSGNLRIVADNEQFPLRAQTMQREFGIGVQDRVGAAILYVGGGSYVDATF
jgi:hypothetical protein